MYIVIGLLSFIFVFYNTWIWKRYGILPSMSASYYKLKEDKRLGKHGKTLFLAFCWSLGALMLAVSSMYYMYDAVGFLFASGAGLIFTGTAAAFEEEMTGVVHYTGATVSIGAAFVGLWLIAGLWPIGAVFLLVSGVFYMLKLKNIILWMEYLAFALSVFGLAMLPQ
jgi:hypothetical protein